MPFENTRMALAKLRLEWLDEPGADERDEQARLYISGVLGHSRKNITNAYLGSSRKRSSSNGR